MARLEGSYEQINLRLVNLEGQVSDIRNDIRGLRTDIDSKFDAADRKVDELRTSLDGKIDGLRASTDGKIDGLRNLIFILFGALAGLITIFEFIN